MKKISLFFAAIIFFSSAFSQSQKLTYQLKKGDTYLQNISIESLIKQTMMGQTMEVSMNIIMNTASTVSEVNATGFKMETVYTKIAANTSVMGQNINYSSDENDSPSAGMEKFSIILKSLTKTPFTMEMNKQGEVIKVSGFDSLANAMIAAEGMSGAEGDQIKASLGQQFSDEALMNQLKQTSCVFPDKALSVGDSWTQTATVTTTMTMNIETKYTVKSLSKTTAVLDIASSITVPEQGMEVNGIAAMAQMSGTQTGTRTIDIATGWGVSALIDQSISGDIEVQGMKIPMEIKSTTTVTNK